MAVLETTFAAGLGVVTDFLKSQANNDLGYQSRNYTNASYPKDTLKLFTSHGSITKLVSSLVVTPNIIVTKDAFRSDKIDAILTSNLDLFTTFYAQAFEIMTGLGNRPAVEAINALSTNRYTVGGMIGRKVMQKGSEYIINNFLNNESITLANLDFTDPRFFNLENISRTSSRNNNNSNSNRSTSSNRGNDGDSYTDITTKDNSINNRSSSEETQSYSIGMGNNMQKEIDAVVYNQLIRTVKITIGYDRASASVQDSSNNITNNRRAYPDRHNPDVNGDVEYEQIIMIRNDPEFTEEEKAEYIAEIEEARRSKRRNLSRRTEEAIRRAMENSTRNSNNARNEVTTRARGQLELTLIIRANVMVVDIAEIENCITTKDVTKTFYYRWLEAMSGGISFISDFILCNDLIKDYKQKRMGKHSSLLDKIENMNNVKSVRRAMDGEPGFEASYNMYVITTDDKVRLDSKALGDITKDTNKDKLLSSLNGFSLNILDLDYNNVSMHLRDIPGAAKIGLKRLENRKDKTEDFFEIYKMISAGNLPRF